MKKTFKNILAVAGVLGLTFALNLSLIHISEPTRPST